MHNHDNNSPHSWQGNNQQHNPQQDINNSAFYPMNQHEIERNKLERKIKSGRNSLLLIAVLSFANILLTALNVNLSFAFSLTGASLFFAIGSNISLSAGFIFAIIPVVVFFLIFVFSKKSRGSSIVALILFAFDCLLLGFIILNSLESAFEFIIDIIFHIWALGSIIGLVSSQSKMNKLMNQYAYNYQNQYFPQMPNQPYQQDYNNMNISGVQGQPFVPDNSSAQYSPLQQYQPPMETNIDDELDEAIFNDFTDDALQTSNEKYHSDVYSWNMPEQPVITPHSNDVDSVDLTGITPPEPPKPFDD